MWCGIKSVVWLRVQCSVVWGVVVTTNVGYPDYQVTGPVTTVQYTATQCSTVTTVKYSVVKCSAVQYSRVHTWIVTINLELSIEGSFLCSQLKNIFL